MIASPQYVTTPAGDRLVVLTEAEFNALSRAAEDASDAAAAREGLGSLARDGGMPAEVLYAVQDGANPVAAWRRHRGWSQAELAQRAGLTQAGVARIEAAKSGAGRPATRRKLADALGAPLWSLEG